jgi:hypothetical protein
MTDYQEKAWDCLIKQDGETVLQLLTDYHGMKLLDEDFLDHLVDEGYLEPEEDEEPEDEEPEDEDYIIANSGPLGGMTSASICNGKWADGSRCKEFSMEEEAVKAIKADMTEQKYWPNVWFRDDHGGSTLYDMNS